ncbi:MULTISPECIES: hypothetical protein [Burkholderia]|jgi:hypothetical protein|uniref:Uncharacterized protein n=1 Tax=Burkholderia contaminans TaxID=488447 RepID=A0A1E3FN80_9BURK|nr:hypothetical protein [Burkholderia contaminans]ELK7724894.1 hypothetical protein [Burkholderia cenocepacia]UTP27886.1 hypothetical protein NMB33_40325 [Burkholderia sp. FXe9]HBN6128839.1 hypothetical protein [Clostridioides difficile]MBA9833396.1 hypothetical protein [Burkholderia contaminans]MBH9693767.1 hypothetical protein [Burkholderia contaminans]
MVSASTNVVSIAQFKSAKQTAVAQQEMTLSTAFEPEDSEDIQFRVGSDRKPAHLSHSWENRTPRAPLTSSTPLGDAALDGIYRLLRGQRAAPARRPALDVPTWQLQGS